MTPMSFRLAGEQPGDPAAYPGPVSTQPTTSLTDLLHPSWSRALAPATETVRGIGAFLRAELAGGHGYLPAGEHILRVFQQPLDQVRVLIVGQDPYPTPGHAVGLSFSVAPEVTPIPRSLQN